MKNIQRRLPYKRQSPYRDVLRERERYENMRREFERKRDPYAQERERYQDLVEKLRKKYEK